MKKTSKILAAIIVATLALTGCNANKEENKEPEQKVEETKPEEKEPIKPDTKDVKVKSLEDVEKIVKEKHPDIKFNEIEFNENKGKAYYEIKALEGEHTIEMKIDKTLGEVLEDKIDEKADREDKLETFTLEDVKNFGEAINMVQEKAGSDAKLLGWEIKFDDGKLIYEIEGEVKGDKKEVKIDAKDNSIIDIDN